MEASTRARVEEFWARRISDTPERLRAGLPPARTSAAGCVLRPRTRGVGLSNSASLAVGKALGFEAFATTFGGSWPEETRVHPVFHLTPQSELRSGTRENAYWPAGFAADGFVHCSPTPEVLLAVARAFYASVAEPLLVLRIEPARLTSPLRFEPAASGGSELPGVPKETLFPHVYGPIDLSAISGVGALERRAGDVVWPKDLAPFQ